jgi:uncharacterized protein YbjT (DUF2867 family)
MENTPLRAETVFVVGATGNLGMEVCRLLVQAKKNVKGFIRTTSDPARVQALKDMGVETVTGDIKDMSSLMPACQGADAIISTATSTVSRQQGDSIETVDHNGQLNVVDAAVTGGVKKFVFISFPQMPGEFSLQTAKRSVENKLQESKLDYTILRPSYFMEVWLSPALGFDYPNAKATIYGGGENKISWVSLYDVASFAVASLDNPAARNEIIELGGPEALSPHQVVKIFEEHMGKSYSLQQVPVEALQAQRDAAPDPLSKSFASLMLGIAAGSEINMKKTLQDFPIKLRSIHDYVERVMPVEEVA